MSSFEFLVDDWLGASFNTSNVVAHWVQASLGWVDFNDALKCLLTTGKLVLPEYALRLAFL